MSDYSEPAAFERILEYLRQTRGFDFIAYKRASHLFAEVGRQVGSVRQYVRARSESSRDDAWP